jgi:hypothetical protein
MTSGFKPGRYQDASPTIRGFHYQIQQTLDRWLDLKNDELLVLECGEDIDKVLHSESSIEAKRELEQVKSRNQNITLRSSDAIEAMVNYCAHLQNNSELVLLYRFTTTASVGRERLSPFKNSEKGIEVWESLRSTDEWSGHDKNMLRQLCELLKNLGQPKKCSDEDWDEFIKIVDGEGIVSIEDFIRSFEWSCEQRDCTDLRGHLIDRLESIELRDKKAAENRYDQILAYLLTLLSQDGDKTLSSRDLGDIFNRSTLGQRDRDTLRFHEQIIQTHSDKIASLQQAFENLPSLLNQHPLLFGSAVEGMSSIDPYPALAAPPPLVAKLARRTDTISKFEEDLPCPGWLAIHGDYGMGKSHLALLTCDLLGGVVLGISMLGLDNESAGHSLLSLASKSNLLSSLMSSEQGVILIDNIPSFPPGSALGEALLLLAKIAGKAKRSLVSTSRYEFSDSFTGRLPFPVVLRQTPSFSDTDTDELFRAHGVGSAFLSEKSVATLNQMCSGHPVLLTALARYLVSNAQEPESALYEALAGEHRREIDLETTRVVLDTIESSQCRQLLYRLASANTPLTRDEIQLVAGAKPALPEPTACIARLDGLWLRRVSKHRYEVSPLAISLGNDVETKVKKSVHREVASLILKRSGIGPSEFIKAVASLLIADERVMAASILVKGYMDARDKDIDYDALGILYFFPPDRPSDLPHSSELPLRAAQSVIASVTQEDPLPYTNRIQEIVADGSSEYSVGATLAGSMLVVARPKSSAGMAILGASLIEQFYHVADLPPELDQEWSSQFDGAHVLIASGSVSTWDELFEYVNIFSKISSERRDHLLGLTGIIEGAHLLFFRPMFDADLNVMPHSMARLTQIEEKCDELDLAIYAVESVIARLIILGEYEDDIEGVLKQGECALNKYRDHPTLIAKLTAAIGKQLYLDKQYEKALPMIVQCLSVPGAVVGFERIHCLVDAMNVAWDVGEDPGDFAAELEQVILSEDFGSELLCQLHAQLAVFEWRDGDRRKSFRHYSNAVQNLSLLPESPRSIHLASYLAHCLSYCTTVLQTGEPPETAVDGSPFAVPSPSMFTGINRAAGEVWRRRQGLPSIQLLLGRFAEDLGLRDESASWYDIAFENGMDAKAPVLLTLLTPRSVSAALGKANWASAIEMAIVHGRAMVFSNQFPREGHDILGDEVEFEPLSPSDSYEHECLAEIQALWLLLPMLSSEIVFRKIADDSIDRYLDDINSALLIASGVSVVGQGWRAVIDVLELFQANSMPVADHRNALHVLEGEPIAEPVRFFAHCILALHRDADLGQAVASQVNVLRYLVPNTQLLVTSGDKYMRAVIAFWEAAIVNQRFRFGMPSHIDEVVNETALMPLEERVRLILNSVLSSLRVRVSEESRVWLAGKSGTE